MDLKKCAAAMMAGIVLMMLLAGCGSPANSVSGDALESSSIAAETSSSSTSVSSEPVVPEPTPEERELFKSRMIMDVPSFELVQTACSIMMSYSFPIPLGMATMEDESGVYAARFVVDANSKDRSMVNVIEFPYTPDVFLLTEEEYTQQMAVAFEELYGEDATFTVDAYGSLGVVGGYPGVGGICTVQTPDGTIQQMQVFIDAPYTISMTVIDESADQKWITAFAESLMDLEFDVIHTVGVGKVSFLLQGLWKVEPFDGYGPYHMPDRIGQLNAFIIEEVGELATAQEIEDNLQRAKQDAMQSLQSLIDAGYQVEDLGSEVDENSGYVDFLLNTPEGPDAFRRLKIPHRYN